MSQAQAARELDVARTAYRLWEMEAAKPAPDRWRLISRWLGISVTTMLLADELISEVEASTIAGTGRSGVDWDTVGAANQGDFFEQSRTLVKDGVDSGSISEEQADELSAVLDRLEQQRRQTPTIEWTPGELRKAFPATVRTPRAARDAVSLVAVDIPVGALEAARLLTSELVTYGVEHGPPPPARIGLFIDVGRDRLRIEVSDAADVAFDPKARGDGHRLTLLNSVASRWDTSREGDGNVTWFELDLPTPGG